MANAKKVIKAYECCKRPYDRKCDECPYGKDCCHDGMPTFGLIDALVTLKRQQNEIENLKQVAQSMMEGQVIMHG